MKSVVDPVSMLKERLDERGDSIYSEQEEMISPMFEALQQKGIIFVGQGPPGMGKTFVIASVTKALVSKGKRVCIAVPSYTHLKEVMAKHLHELDVEFAILRGRSALEKHEGCPLKNGEVPTSIFCSDQKDAKTGPDSEKCKDMSCAVRKERLQVESANVVLTVFHKLLSSPNNMDKFDVVIFDESHGLEPVVRSIRVAKLRADVLRILQKASPEQESNFDQVIQKIESLRDLGNREVPLRFIEREIVDPIEDTIAEIEMKIYEEEEAGHVDSELTGAFFRLQNAFEAFKNPDKFRYVHHSGLLLAIPTKITFVPSYYRKIGKDTSIALISATIENPKFHAKDSGFSDHTLAPPVQIKSTRFINRFRNRPIFGLIDGPVLRKDPHRPDEYNLGRREANKIIGSVLPYFKFPVLILCRSHNDADSIRSYLSKIQAIRDRLYLFEEEGESEDIDMLETNANREIKKGRDIILTSASSRLWEGINLKGIRMLIVDALPYASPQPYEQIERESWGSWRTSRTFRFMIRRIQQGVGRLIRTEEDPWGIVIVVDGRFSAQWRTIRSALPDYMTSQTITKFVTRKTLPSIMENKMKQLIKSTS